MKIITGIFFSIILLLIVMDATSHAVVSSAGVLDTVLEKYKAAASTWAGTISNHAMRLFWALATISMVWTMMQLLFHRSSLAELFGEFIRYILFVGTFAWFLENAPKLAEAIISSLMQIGAEASKQGYPSPSGIVDLGFKIFDVATSGLSIVPDVSWGGFLIACVILVVLALVGINMLLQLCAAWVLAYAGIFFLGFGGSRWTSDMAINYFKTVLGIGASLMTMTLLVGVGSGIVGEAVAQMKTDPANIKELAVLLVFSITLLFLVDKLPAMVAGIITGAGIGSMGAGSFSAGAALGAAMTAGAAVSGAASMTKSALTGAASMTTSAVTGAAGIGSAISAAAQGVSQRMPGAGSGGASEGRSFSEAMGTTVSYATEVGKSLGGAAAGMARESAGMAAGMAREKFNAAVSDSFGGRLASRLNGNGGDNGNT